MKSILFENQVVLVTGAGRGLGAAYAKMFAERGATVIVHDAGVDRDGAGSDAGLAISVADSIRSKGGKAFAETLNLSTMSACNALIENVLANCSRLDALVHSAGLVAYKGIEETTNEEWERLCRINIEAPFWLSRAVWPIMKRQQYGRIIMTVSGHGLKTFEDSDVIAYGVGKGAQFGLMNGLASEGKKYGIKVNAISPVAATRIFRREVAANQFSPDSVAPGVVLLGSTYCPFTGKVLGAANGKFTISELQSTLECELGQQPTPEDVLEATS